MSGDVVSEIARSKTLRNVAFYASAVALYSLIPVLTETQSQYEHFIELPSDLHAAFTLVLGWLLVFRTNSSYSRWW